MNYRLAMDKAGAWLDDEDFLHGDDGSARQLGLELKAPSPRERIEIASVASGLGEIRNLIDRTEKGCLVGLRLDKSSNIGGKASETLYKRRRPYVQFVRPAIMHQIPDGLCPSLTRCP